MRDYPVFFVYVAYVLASSLVLLRLSRLGPQVYAFGYWVAELISVFAGVAVIWELYGAMFAAYPAVRRMGRVLIGALVALTCSRFAADIVGQPLQALVPTAVELERNLRFLQATVLFGVLVMIGYYRVPLCRNAAYLLYGYTLFVATVLATLALRSSLGAQFHSWWKVLQPAEFLVSVGIWCVGLWSKAPNPAPCRALEEDYARLSKQTALGLARLRERLTEGIR